MKHCLKLVFLFAIVLPLFAQTGTGPLAATYFPSITTTCSSYASNVWVTDVMTKVLQNSGTTPTCTNNSYATNAGQKWAVIYATQGEFADFQVHWHDTGSGTSGLYINTSAFTQSSPSSYSIAAPSTSSNLVNVYREAYITIPSDEYSSTGAVYMQTAANYPDPLIPEIDPYYHQVTDAWPVTVTASDNQSAWIDVFIPDAAPSGYYSGSIYVYTGCSSTLTSCSLQATLPIVIGVWQWPSSGHMPSIPTLPTTTQYGYNDFCAAVSPATCTDNNSASDGAVMFMDHRWTMDDPIQGSSNQIALQLQGNTSGVSTAVPIIPSAQTTGANFRGDNQGFGATPQAFATTYGQFTPPSGSTSATYPNISPFYYIADEPGTTAANWTALCELAVVSGGGGAHQASPAVATLITGYVDAMNYNNTTTGCTTATSGPNGAVNAVDIITVPNFCLWPDVMYTCSAGEGDGTPPVGNNVAEYVTWQSGTAQDGITRSVWSYIACGGAETCSNGIIGPGNYPNYNIDSRPAGNRAGEWMAWLMGQTGELYYYTTGAWEEGNPWTTYMYEFGQWGDGTLAYPSSFGGTHYVTLQSGSALTDEIWLPRMVLKLMRDGGQDYEYLHELTVKGYSSTVVNQIASASMPSFTNIAGISISSGVGWITNAYTYETSGSGLMTARTNLGTTLHEITYPAATGPAASLGTGTKISSGVSVQ